MLWFDAISEGTKTCIAVMFFYNELWFDAISEGTKTFESKTLPVASCGLMQFQKELKREGIAPRS